MYINKIAYYIPSETCLLKDLYQDTGDQVKKRFNEEQFINFYKKYTLTDHICIENKLSRKELYVQIGKTILEGNTTRDNIKYIIVADDYLEKFSTIGHYLQYVLNMQNANIINISGNYCCNIEASLRVAKSLLKDYEDDSDILILTGNIADNNAIRVVGSYGLLSDGFGGILASNYNKNNGIKTEDVTIISDGKFYEMDLFQDNTKEYYKRYKELITKMLKNNDLSPDDIDHVILHNANEILIKHVIKTMGIKEDRIFKNPKRNCGHLDTVDLILNLKSLEGEKEKNAISISIGAAGTYAACLFKF
jgi:3-oxoacyl-[acyl-carrier-protein] synthase III